MMRTLTIVLFLLIAFRSLAQNTDSIGSGESFRQTAIEVIKAFQSGNQDAINKFIHPATGLYVITRPGAFNIVEHKKSIDFAYGGEIIYESHRDMKFDSLRFETLPDYSCADEKWNKRGAYADTTQHDTLMSSSAIICGLAGASVKYSQALIRKFKDMEQKSYKVIVTEQHSTSLMFSLTWMDGKWWLTILDRVSDDCSA